MSHVLRRALPVFALCLATLLGGCVIEPWGGYRHGWYGPGWHGGWHEGWHEEGHGGWRR